LGTLFDAVTAATSMPVPPPGMPGPFSLSDAGELLGLVREAGFAHASVGEVAEPLDVSSFDEWWRLVPSLAGPLAAVIAALPGELAEGIQAHARDASEPFRSPKGLRFPGVALVAAGEAV
jgi:hypothetical protein